jgi:hypothetical protein
LAGLTGFHPTGKLGYGALDCRWPSPARAVAYFPRCHFMKNDKEKKENCTRQNTAENIGRSDRVEK